MSDLSDPPTDPGFRFLPRGGDEAPESGSARQALRSADLAPQVDRATALSFVGYGEYQAYHSFFADLDLAPMRCPLSFEAGRGLTVLDGQAPPALEAADAARGLRDRIDAAVSEAMNGAERVAIWLSGGDDSAAVAASAAHTWRAWQRDPSHLRFYHQQPPEGKPETPAAQAVADALGHELIVVRAEEGDPFARAAVEAYLGTLDYPIDGPGCAQMLAFAARQAEDGTGVFLTGDGGDECFGPREPARGLRAVLRASLPAAALRRYRRRQLPTWLGGGRRAVRDLEHTPRARVGLRGIAAERDRAIRCARQSALVGVHRATAARYGMRAAFPLLAPGVMDFAVAVPQDLHGDRAHPKQLLKQACADRLPEAVRARTKADQPYAESSVALDVQRYGAAWRERWLEGGRLESSGLISRAEAESVFRSTSQGPRALYRVFALVGLEIWLRAWDLAP